MEEEEFNKCLTMFYADLTGFEVHAIESQIAKRDT